MLSVLGLTAQLLVAAPADTLPSTGLPPQQRPKAVEVSEWYERRLTLHRRLSYAIIPLFGFQWAAGQQIWDKGAGAPAWARNGHRVGAATIAGAFTVNVVTGAWNLWDSRAVQEGRERRNLHAISMLIASAGFTYAGAKLSEEAELDASKRTLHRNVALTSIAITVTSGLLMKFLND